MEFPVGFHPCNVYVRISVISGRESKQRCYSYLVRSRNTTGKACWNVTPTCSLSWNYISIGSLFFVAIRLKYFVGNSFKCRKCDPEFIKLKALRHRNDKMDDRTIDRVFAGGLEELPPVSSKIVRIFTSSTFTGNVQKMRNINFLTIPQRLTNS